MVGRKVEEVPGTADGGGWGKGTVRPVGVAGDGLGFAVTDTYVRPGTETLLRYHNHLEACYCVEGTGRLTTADGTWALEPGTLYAPGKGEEHRVASDTGMRLICVFNPPLRGDESHRPIPGRPSGY